MSDAHTDLDLDRVNAQREELAEKIEELARERHNRPIGKFHEIAHGIANLLEEKNKAYGNSFDVCNKFLELLYPNGVKVEQYHDMLTLVRMFDKQKRIATDKDAFGEDPYRDVAGYAILAINGRRPQVHPTTEEMEAYVNAPPKPIPEEPYAQAYVVEKVQEDGICTYLSDPGKMQWTTVYKEAYQFSTTHNAKHFIHANSDAKVVPVARNKML